MLGTTTAFANSVADILKKLVDEGKIGSKVAMVNVADEFGIELAEAARPIFKKHGLEIVYDKSYPLGTQDVSPIVKGAKAAESGCLRRLVVPARHLRDHRAGQDRGHQRQGLLHRGGDAVPRLSSASSASRSRTTWVPAASTSTSRR